jgi:hypothetical protein
MARGGIDMGSAGPRLGTVRRGPDDFSDVITAACVAAAVSIGLAGCGYPVHQRASGWLVVETSHIQLRTNIGRGAAVRLASEMRDWPDSSRRCSWRQTG